ncbi:hypothetical protein L6452_37826 [Arctium lappa]|uniref:Uncharacterized protein n=1 Tax=Arctium lappa TaxID=4217 RepID=A0ACB8Y4K3_ARCLA|nr:hypothetical protein L6452_37826 [Arctium lappa]
MSPVVQSSSLDSLQSGQASNVCEIQLGAKTNISATIDATIEHEIRMGTLDPNMDRKSMRRIISNRIAAKKSHEKKMNKVAELEKNRINLEGTVATLHTQIEHEQQLQSRLRVENEMMTQQFRIYVDLNDLKAAQIAEKTMEEQALRELLNMQLQNQRDN